MSTGLSPACKISSVINNQEYQSLPQVATPVPNRLFSNVSTFDTATKTLEGERVSTCLNDNFKVPVITEAMRSRAIVKWHAKQVPNQLIFLTPPSVHSTVDAEEEIDENPEEYFHELNKLMDEEPDEGARRILIKFLQEKVNQMAQNDKR